MILNNENFMEKVIDNSKTVNKTKDRKLGDEWKDWNGKNSTVIDSKKNIFLIFAFGVIILFHLIIYGFYYLVIPRLSEFYTHLPLIILIMLGIFSIYIIFWYLVLLITSYTNFRLDFLGKGNRLLLGFLLDNVFKLGQLIRYSKDKLGNSFVKVSNSFVRGTKKLTGKEKILVLLPRCLTKEMYQSIKDISKEYNIEMAVCTGGEIARQKIKEFRPSAVIGVACERDLVSGIKDVGTKISTLGIPNIRPEGPCKNTYIDIESLRNCIKFYLS